MITLDVEYLDASVNGTITYTVVARDKATRAEFCRDRFDLRDADARDRFARAVATATGFETIASDVAANLASKLDETLLAPVTAGELVRKNLPLYPPLIHGFLRLYETMNVIAASKTGKSWLALMIALCVATGRNLFGLFRCERARVLLLDNELHERTIGRRLQHVAEAMGIDAAEYAEQIDVISLRGRLKNIFQIGPNLRRFAPGYYGVVILDAMYRMYPPGTDENDNGALAEIFNAIDSYSESMRAAFICVHHSSKGLQGDKRTTDVGSGAGVISRAADSHIILREHEEDGVVVLEGAVRSWPPVAPACLRWDFPLWKAAPECDPTQLRKSKPKPRKDEVETPPAWTVERFVGRFVSDKPQTEDTILIAAKLEQLSGALAKQLLRAAEEANKVHRWTFGPRAKVKFSTAEQPVTETTDRGNQ
jgi:hypothetical protein